MSAPPDHGLGETENRNPGVFERVSVEKDEERSCDFADYYGNIGCAYES
jgi:hypothetical protein